jgi:Tat protein secretion system quality control protein TatD with DNase activity
MHRDAFRGEYREYKEVYGDLNNEPCVVKFVCSEIARIRGVSAEDLAGVTVANSNRAFSVASIDR